MDNRASNGMKFRYRTNEEMKESGVEWLGKIPNEWLILKLRNLGNISTSSVDKKIEEKDKIVKLVNYVDIYNSKTKEIYNNSDYMKVSAKEKQIETCDLIKGDVLFTPSSETINDIGYSAVVMEDLDNTLYSYHIVRLRFNRDIYLNFKKYMFWSNSFLNYLSSRATGTTRKTLSLNDFKENKVVIPLKEEQEKIAKFLDIKTAEFDSIISKKEALIKKLEEAKKSLISEVVTGKVKVIKTEEGYQLIKRKKEEMKDSGVEWLGDIPKNWDINRLKYVGEAITGLTYSPKDIVNENEGVLVLRSSNVKNGKIVLQDNVYVNMNIPNKLVTKKGDIIICSRNGSRSLIGKNACIREENEGVSFGAFMTIFRSKHYEYLNFVFNSEIFKAQAGSFLTSTINQLTIGNLNSFIIPVPNFEDQNNIIEYLKQKVEKYENILDSISNQIEKIKLAKQSLISEAVTGKIEVLD
ncbi:restriction endonuclease subunit S [Clostridium sp.]|uniref:restriction endonuclease subunit S n=1 Tax=Clostridium sp. TaxID=1506 RepID=UPI00290EC1D2|nr:restriction endonuclease subunit S [Clostridium sp.]MDU7240414.1 restriction endonuclease subunit S [Clostridium sp.]